MSAENTDRNKIIFREWQKAEALAKKHENPKLKKGYKKLGKTFNLHYTVVGRIIRRELAKLEKGS